MYRGAVFFIGEIQADNGRPVMARRARSRCSNTCSDTPAVEQFDQLEHGAQTADEYSRLLEGLAPIVRSMRNLLEVLEDARKAVPSDRSLIDHRDRAYELARWAD